MTSGTAKALTVALWIIAGALVALALQPADGKAREASVVLSGVAPVPWRSHPVEQALSGKALDATTIAAAAAAAVQGAEPLAANAYKLHLLQGLVKDQLEAIT